MEGGKDEDKEASYKANLMVQVWNDEGLIQSG